MLCTNEMSSTDQKEEWSMKNAATFVLGSLHRATEIHNRTKTTGTKILEELIFLIFVAECDFQTHDKYLKAVWVLRNSSRFVHYAL